MIIIIAGLPMSVIYLTNVIYSYRKTILILKSKKKKRTSAASAFCAILEVLPPKRHLGPIKARGKHGVLQFSHLHDQKCKLWLPNGLGKLSAFAQTCFEFNEN